MSLADELEAVRRKGKNLSNGELYTKVKCFARVGRTDEDYAGNVRVSEAHRLDDECL
jgi:DNA-binding IclR family transcriptional regulator